MINNIIEIKIKSVIPTESGVSIFLGRSKKVFVIYINKNIGSTLMSLLNNDSNIRPKTHDILFSCILSFGGKVTKIIINDFNDAIFYSKITIEAQNEIMDRKIIEIDSRPSDSIILATYFKSPIFVSSNVWNNIEDMSYILNKMKKKYNGNNNLNSY